MNSIHNDLDDHYLVRIILYNILINISGMKTECQSIFMGCILSGEDSWATIDGESCPGWSRFSSEVSGVTGIGTEVPEGNVVALSTVPSSHLVSYPFEFLSERIVNDLMIRPAYYFFIMGPLQMQKFCRRWFPLIYRGEWLHTRIFRVGSFRD